MKLSNLSPLFALALMASAQAATPKTSWRYYRPSNTGIQGDFNEALWIAPDGDPWIGGYDASFEEGGIAKFLQSQNRWLNVSNVDYPVIGHPERTGTSRISDIDIDANGRMWMATGRGALFFDPKVGPTSLRRFGDDNSPIPGGWNRGVEIAPDGTVWFSAYATVWGAGGVSQYNPATNQWRVFPQFGTGNLALQTKPGGYFVWTGSNETVARYDSASNTWTAIARQNGNPAYIVGNNSTDSAGNTWMYKWTNATLFETRLDLRRPDGTWMNVPRAPFDTQANGASAIRVKTPQLTYFVDGGGTAYKFNGSTWTSLGMAYNNTSTYDVDADAAGNVWICGVGGASKRDVTTGSWQRYRITNTSQFDFFNNDLSLTANGGLYACANAGPGYGGMVKFDGQRWTGFNGAQYGLGFDWPFPTDNSTKVYVRPSNGHLIVNPMFNGLYEYDGVTFTNLNSPVDTVNGVVEDSTGRLWITFYGNLMVRNGSTWTQVSALGGTKLERDPVLPGTVWCMGDQTIMRTNGTSTYLRQLASFPGTDPQSDQFKGFAIAANGHVWLGSNTINLPDNSCVINLNPATNQATMYRKTGKWPFPGEYAMPLEATPDGRVWMQYDSDYLVAQRGLFWFDGTSVGSFPAPPGGEPQWGGLPHAGIVDSELRIVPGGYELWLSCASRGIAVLTVKGPALISPAP